MKNTFRNSSDYLPRFIAPFILIALVCLFNLSLLMSDFSLIRTITLFFLPVILIYFALNFDKIYILFTLVFAIPFALDISSMQNLMALTLLAPGIFILYLVRVLASNDTGPGIKILPLPVIIFFILGFISFWRHPSLPTTLLGPTIDYGNFRNYWKFFVGLITYFLAYHLFEDDKGKFKVLIKLLFFLYVFSLLVNITMSIFGILRLPGFIPEAFGPVSGTGKITLRSGALGRYGMKLFILLLVFKEYPRSQLLKILVFLFSIFAIIASGARGTLITILMAAFMYFILRKKLLKLAILLGVIVAIFLTSYLFPQLINQLPPPFQRVFTFFSPSPASGAGTAVINAKWRFKYWQSGLHIISQHPLFGIGFVRLGREYLYAQLSEYIPRIGGAHNAYLATAVMLGVPGLILLLWIFQLHLKRGIILFRLSQDSFNRQFNLWLVIMMFSYNVIYLFGGGPQDLYQYFFYAGLLNLNWFLLKKG
jgi:O-antigen ligase